MKVMSTEKQAASALPMKRIRTFAALGVLAVGTCGGPVRAHGPVCSPVASVPAWCVSVGDACSVDVLEIRPAAGSECVQPGETVTVELHQRDLDQPVRGFQAFIQFDDSMVTHVSNSFETCPGVCPPALLVPYGLPILNSVTGEEIDLAAGIDDLSGQSPTADDALLVTLEFTAGPSEGSTSIGFRTHDPPSRFSDEFGGEVVPCLADSPPIVIDGTAPVITCPADVTVECGEPIEPSHTGEATAIDNLDPGPAVSYSDDEAPGPCPQGAQITRTWTAQDCAGNSSSCVQIITVLEGACAVDVLEFRPAPGSECVRPGESVVVELYQRDLDQPVRGFQAFARFDGSAMAHVSNTFESCPGTCPPDLRFPYGLPILDSVAGAEIDLAAGIDDLSGQTPTIDDALLVTLAFVAGAAEGATSVGFRTHDPPSRFSDEFGLEVVPCHVASPPITIDGTSPAITCPPDVTIECDEPTDPSHTGAATATDNLDPDPAITFSDVTTTGLCPQEGTITRTWTATDCAGNADACVQTLLVVDTTAPVITCPPDDVTTCGGPPDPSETGAATATDNCDPNPLVTYSDASVGECPTSITRTWSATDACGHSSSCVQLISGACAIGVTLEGCLVGNDCLGKVERMTLEYTGEGCDASHHHQAPGSVTCSGDPALAEPVRVLVTNQNGVKVYADVSGVLIGDAVVADAAQAALPHFGSQTRVRIFDAQGALLQDVQFHTSCSEPLSVGDQFGGVRLVAMTTTEGGEVAEDECVTEIPPGGVEVEYTYVVTNLSGVTLTNVTVIDDVYGAVPGSPIASLAAGESVTLSLTVFVTGPTTSTVTVTGHVGDVTCTATASTTITTKQGDCDDDGDVDLDDLQVLVGCMTGPGGGLLPDCDCADLDNDLDVDLEDFAMFQTAFTGGP